MPKYIDLFAGCGGISLGLKKSGWNGIFAIERNSDAFSTFKHNLLSENSHFSWPKWLKKTNHDIYDILDNYTDKLEELSGKVDLIVGGPPCQGFSMAGRRQKDDVRNNLVDAYLDFVNIVKPKAILLENVHGFTIPFEPGEVPYSLYVKNTLEHMGYNVTSKELVFSKYGVPQNRKRFILVGTLEKKDINFFEELDSNVEKFMSDKQLDFDVTIASAISDLNKANGTYKSKEFKKFDFGMYSNENSQYQRLMRCSIANNVNPDSHRFANHKPATISLFNFISGLSTSTLKLTPATEPSGRLKKRSVTVLKSDTVCNTITSIPDDYIHYCEPRIMTPREMARIQSFPDDYVFLGKYTTGGKERKKDVPRYTQIANAVPPLFSEQAGNVLKKLVRKK